MCFNFEKNRKNRNKTRWERFDYVYIPQRLSNNHLIDGLLRYDIVPLIFPRKNFKLEKVLNSIQLTLDFFNDKAYRI